MVNLFFEVRRPQVFHQQPHYKRGHNRVDAVIEEADWDEPEDEGMRRAPEPVVLVQHVQSTNESNQECSLHSIVSIAITESLRNIA